METRNTDSVLGTPHKAQKQCIEIPLIGQGEWDSISYDSVVSGKYGISTPDGKQLNEQQVAAVLLMECWYLEREEFFRTPLGNYLLNQAVPASDCIGDELNDFLNSWFKGDFTLVGFAGTGKTASLQAFLHRIKQHCHLLITATTPTNKALKVLKSFGKSSNITGIEYQTIYQALGIKMETDDDGKEIALEDKDGKQNLQDFDLAILDEASMLNASMHGRIVGLTRRPKFIFMGDSKQLKPVGDETVSPVFTNVLATITLSKVMRYPEDSAIGRLVTTVRDSVGQSDWIDPSHYADNESVIVTDNENFLDMLLEDLMSDRYQDNKDFAKVVCYTNVVVDWINDWCHKKLFGNKAEAFVLEERLVSTKPVTRRRYGMPNEVILKNRFEVDVLRSVEDEKIWNGSDAFQLFEDHLSNVEYLTHKQKGKVIKTSTKEILASLKEANKAFKYWQVRASVVDEDRKVNLDLIDPVERTRYKSTIDALRLLSLGTPERSRERKRAWAIMYAFIRLFDPVVHSYAGTAHSSQGSSYNHVYVTLKDIQRCKDALERSQLYYVAYSRAMEKLIISL